MVSNGPGRINQAFSVRSSTWPKSQLRADWANEQEGKHRLLGAPPPPAPRFARPGTLRAPSHPASPSYRRPTADAFDFWGNGGEVTTNLKRQSARIGRRDGYAAANAPQGGASGFGSAHSSTFAPADSDLKGRGRGFGRLFMIDRQRRAEYAGEILSSRAAT
ncbi:hypothetical protein DM480_17720 (plasmid) [Sphingomonas sp. FARSPH]|nr:hypothetical protein DM480_17720 [Sphingomonas sp. FARSPH]